MKNRQGNTRGENLQGIKPNKTTRFRINKADGLRVARRGFFKARGKNVVIHTSTMVIGRGVGECGKRKSDSVRGKKWRRDDVSVRGADNVDEACGDDNGGG